MLTAPIALIARQLGANEGEFVRGKGGRAGLGGLGAVALVALVGCGANGEPEGEPERASAPAASATPSSSESSASAAQSPTGTRLASGVLQSRWWTWAASEPEGTNPVADESGSQCARNQAGDVWFLAGTFGTQVTRACTVPEGIPIAFPLVNLVADEADCADFMSTAEGSAVLDGEKVDPDEIAGDEISAQAVAGNPVTGGDGDFTGTGCGLWVQMPALDPGEHSLTIRGRSGDFSVGVDYLLTVEAS